jgi:putative NIF3 family GTP cyclohydrolase 1 type 2
MEMKAAEIAAVVETIAPISSGMAGDELGFVYGTGNRKISGVAVCWSPTLRALREAERLACNMIISHEPLFYQKRWSVDAEAKNTWFVEAEDKAKPVNRRRAAQLKKMGGCVWRAHSNWDIAPKLGIVDALIQTLDLGPIVRRGFLTTLHRIPRISVRRLASRVRRRLDTGPIRIVGDPARQVSRVATMIGGLGQMFNSVEEAAALGAEAVVAGECLAYTLWNAQELNLSLIEAGHGACENPGMRAMAHWLAEELNGVPVRFIDTGLAWRYL